MPTSSTPRVPKPQRSNDRASRPRPTAKSQQRNTRTCGEFGGLTETGKKCDNPATGAKHDQPCYLHKHQRASTATAVDVSALPDDVRRALERDDNEEPVADVQAANQDTLSTTIRGRLRLPWREDVELYPLCLWGDSGIGKSERVKQIAAEEGYTTLTLSLATMDATTLEGLPVLKDEGERRARVEYAMSEVAAKAWDAHDRGEDVLLFCDELNHASLLVHQALFPVMLPDSADGARYLASHKLPPGTRVVAACNPPQVDSVLQDLPRTFETRLQHVKAETTTEEWLDYLHHKDETTMQDVMDRVPLSADEGGFESDSDMELAIRRAIAQVEEVVPAVTAYIDGEPAHLQDTSIEAANAASAEDVEGHAYTRGTPTGRSWMKLIQQLAVSRAQHQMREAGEPPYDTPTQRRAAAIGYLGATVGNQFASFYEDLQGMPHPSEVLKERTPEMVGTGPRAYYQTMRVANYVREQNDEAGFHAAMTLMLNMREEADPSNSKSDWAGTLAYGEMGLRRLMRNATPAMRDSLPKTTVERMSKGNIDWWSEVKQTDGDDDA